MLSELKGFELVATLVLEFKKIQSDDTTLCSTFHWNSKTEPIINKTGIRDVFQSIYSNIMSNTQKSLGQDSDWIIDSVIDHSLDISNYNQLPGSNYFKLPKELDYPTTV